MRALSWLWTRGRPTVLLLGCLTLTACASAPPVKVSEAEVQDLWRQRQAVLAAGAEWRLDGRIAVRDDGQAWQSKMRWSQHADQYDIRLLSFLGQQLVRIEFDGKGPVSYQSPEETVFAIDGETLLQDQLGWSVPLEALRYWVVGLAGPGPGGHLRFDAGGRLALLEQAGWRIEYQRYQRVGTIDLPARIEMRRAQVRVRLVIDEWSW